MTIKSLGKKHVYPVPGSHANLNINIFNKDLCPKKLLGITWELYKNKSCNKDNHFSQPSKLRNKWICYVDQLH
jgi:hypothetical protein